MHKANDFLKILKPKLRINYCSLFSLNAYIGTFDRMLCFLNVDTHILEHLLDDQRFKDILMDRHRSLVIHREMEIGSNLRDDIRKMKNVKIVNNFSQTTLWWPYILSFFYSNPKANEIRQMKEPICLVLFDHNSKQQKQLAEKFKNTFSNLEVSSCLMCTKDFWKTPRMIQTIKHVRLTIVCGLLPKRTAVELEKIVWRRTGFRVYAITDQPLQNAEIISKVFTDIGDFGL